MKSVRKEALDMDTVRKEVIMLGKEGRGGETNEGGAGNKTDKGTGGFKLEVVEGERKKWQE